MQSVQQAITSAKRRKRCNVFSLPSQHAICCCTVFGLLVVPSVGAFNLPSMMRRPAMQKNIMPLSSLRRSITAQTRGHARVQMTAATSDEMSRIWSDQWYPLQFEKSADRGKPSSCTVLGAPVVFWWDNYAWRALVDRCPHRMVPLSEGRISKAGDIECPYHGWTFRGCDGACTSIPQLDRDMESINKERAQARVLPVLVRDGVIWMWAASLLGSSAEPDLDKLDSILVDAIGKPGVLYVDYFRDLWMDATVLCENVMDPSHLPFTHHETISNRKRAGPLPCKLESEISQDGFVGSKIVGNSSTPGSIIFKAPHHVLSMTERPSSFSDWNVVYAVPVAPGRCRLFVRVVFEVSRMPLPLSWIFGVSFRLPEALLHINNHKILEDDNIFLHLQDLALRNDADTLLPSSLPSSSDADASSSRGEGSARPEQSAAGQLSPDWQKRLYLPSKADALVVAYRIWLDKFTGGHGPRWSATSNEACGTRRQGAPASASVPAKQRRAQLLERLAAHTESCASCSQARAVAQQAHVLAKTALPCVLLLAACAGSSTVQSVAAVVASMSIVIAVASWTLVEATQTGAYPPPRNRK